MKPWPLVLALVIPFAGAQGANRNIDMEGYLRVSLAAAGHRESRRVSEQDELHVKGALNLSFPDIALESLARAIPDRNTRILIYCNNNFESAPGPFPTKLPSASLNLSTYIALYNYGSSI